MRIDRRTLASRLGTNQLGVFLNADDVLTVVRAVKGGQLPSDTCSMTVSEALEYGAWDTSRGTMTAIVLYNDSPAYRFGRRVYAAISTGDRLGWEAQADEPRESLHAWSYDY